MEGPGEGAQEWGEGCRGGAHSASPGPGAPSEQDSVGALDSKSWGWAQRLAIKHCGIELKPQPGPFGDKGKGPEWEFACPQFRTHIPQLDGWSLSILEEPGLWWPLCPSPPSPVDCHPCS